MHTLACVFKVVAYVFLSANCKTMGQGNKSNGTFSDTINIQPQWIPKQLED